jgi:hypothetical protein
MVCPASSKGAGMFFPWILRWQGEDFGGFPLGLKIVYKIQNTVQNLA